MKITTGSTWNNLISQEAESPVTELRTLRPSQPDFFQYIRADGLEIAAVHMLEPYGSLTHQAFTKEHDDLHLLPAIEAGDDYVAFEVPIDTLTLKAATLGTGWRRSILMAPVYENLGKIVREMAEKTGLPRITLGDIALQRAGGQLVFIPPLNFKGERSDSSAALVSFKASLQDELSSVFRAHYISGFEALLEGIEAQP